MPSRPPVPNYFQPREKRQLLRLMFAVALVVVAWQLASNPENWQWLTGDGKGKAGRPARPVAKQPLVKPPIDEPLEPGTIRLVPSVTGDTTKPSATAEHIPGPDDLEIAPELLATVQDNVVGIRRQENDAYYALLAKARDIPQSVLEKGARDDLSFTSIYNEPERYRGQLITLDGELRRFTELEATGNEQGLVTLYEGWLFTEDGGKSNPYRIICTAKPRDFPVGDEVRERVRFTGFFFKRYGYPTAHGLHFAPLLLGKRLRWTPSGNAPTTARGWAPAVLASVLVLGLAFAGVVWWYTVREKRLHTTPLARVTEPRRDEIASLDGLEATDINDVLRRIADEHREEELGPGDGRASES